MTGKPGVSFAVEPYPGGIETHKERWRNTFGEAVPVLSIEALGPFEEHDLAAYDI
jgi:hypothetical protein